MEYLEVIREEARLVSEITCHPGPATEAMYEISIDISVAKLGGKAGRGVLL